MENQVKKMVSENNIAEIVRQFWEIIAFFTLPLEQTSVPGSHLRHR